MAETIQRPLNLKQAAEFLGFKPSYMYNLVHYGKLTAFKPSGKVLFFKQEDLEKFIFRGKKTADFELAEQADTVLTGGLVRTTTRSETSVDAGEVQSVH